MCCCNKIKNETTTLQKILIAVGAVVAVAGAVFGIVKLVQRLLVPKCDGDCEKCENPCDAEEVLEEEAAVESECEEAACEEAPCEEAAACEEAAEEQPAEEA